MMALAALTIAGCLAVSPSSDQILAGDLAAAFPGFTAPAPDAHVSPAPAPGVQRVFHVPELRRLALRLHWDVEPTEDVCVEWTVTPPDPPRLLAAMQKALPQADISIVEYGRQNLPAGEITFPVSGLRPAGASGAMWVGYVQYAGTRRFPVWARVKAAVSVSRVVAVTSLLPGHPITVEQVRTEARQELPQAGGFLVSAEEAVGKRPRATVRAGSVLRPEMLETPKDVMRGDTVQVDVRNGAAHLELEAQAEASGSVGETISVLNPASHKRFLARVEGKGRVSVGTSAAKVNP